MKIRLAKRHLFFLAVLMLYALAFYYDATRARQAWQYSLDLARQLLPILLLVFVIMLFSNFALNRQWVKKHLGRDSGRKAWLFAAIGGIFSPGPIYPWLSFLKELQDRGMRPALIAVFLYSRGLKLPMLPLLIHYFGPLYALVLSVYIPLFALLSGLLIEKVPSLRDQK